MPTFIFLKQGNWVAETGMVVGHFSIHVLYKNSRFIFDRQTIKLWNKVQKAHLLGYSLQTVIVEHEL